ncbi:hypothetical protein CLAIMM_13157 [Cladophialophora immunda]|nr:hypothetical protein CLAIMM_13157 [Cladophialophora immunda]
MINKPYLEVAAKAQAEVLDAIPAKWKLSPAQLDLAPNANVTDIPRTCGLLTPAQIAITEQTATELLAKMATGELTSVAVTEAFCARAAIAQQLTNCLIAFFPDEALSTAAALDEHLAKTGKPVGPLHGLPVCIKDMYDVKGHRTTMGFISWFDVVAEKDAVLVRMLREAGAVFHAKTTMPQTGMMLETKSHLWGITRNPYNRSLGAGGSSGGDGALIAMRGSPIAPSSDIGGSIRVPAAYNGLYSLKPSADRIPRGGLRSPAPGNISIKVSCGPQCHSVADMKMFAKVINAYPTAQFEPNVVPLPWRDVQAPKGKLSVGLWEFDGVVTPHPPIQRALRETAQKLISAGHEVIPVTLPFDCWEVLVTTRKLFFQTGFQEGKAVLAAGGEDMMPGVNFALTTFNTKPLAITELFACNTQMSMWKGQMSAWWSATAAKTSTGRPIDALIGPVNPSASAPHDMPGYCGYTSVFNILDYPATTLPLKSFRISAEKDPKDPDYQPVQGNPYDKMIYDMYDPELFAAQPVCLQVAGRPFQDEEVVAVTEALDLVLNS